MNTPYLNLLNTQWGKLNIIILMFVMCSISLFTASKCKGTSTTYYVVTFNAMGGSNVSPQNIAPKETANKPTDPTRKNYTFMGWYGDQGLTKAFNFATPITADTTLYASWAVNPGLIGYTVSFNSNGGTQIGAQMVVEKDFVIKPTDPKLANNTFIGWYTDPNFTKAYDFATPVTTNFILYAKWNNPQPSLSNVVASGIIPTNIASYDLFTQQVLSPYPAGAKVSAVYVTTSGTGKKDGTSWDNAYAADNLKTAIDNIQDASSNKVYLVLIGAGIYTPNTSLSMKNNVAIIGGFSATGGWTRNATDSTVIHRMNTPNFNNLETYEVSMAFNNNNLDHTAMLYGIFFSQGDNAIYNTNASPTIMNVIFSNNLSVAIYNDNSSPLITNAIFINNVNDFGAGISNQNNSSPIVVNAIFLNNYSNNEVGGGMLTATGAPVLINVVFIGNRTTASTSAAIGNYSAATTLVVNGIFWGNISSRGSTAETDQYDDETEVLYSIVSGGSGPTIIATDPGINNTLTYTSDNFMPTLKYTGNAPDNQGVFVMRSATATNGKFILYYSIDHQQWYTDPKTIGTGTAVALPPNTIEITATDIQNKPRIGRPSPGVWAK